MLGSLLGLSWGDLVCCQGVLGVPWALLGAPGALFGWPGAFQGRFGGPLGHSGVVLGRWICRPGNSGRPMGALGCIPRAFLGALGASWERFCMVWGGILGNVLGAGAGLGMPGAGLCVLELAYVC